MNRHNLKHVLVQEKFLCHWPECRFKGTSRADNLQRHMRNFHSPGASKNEHKIQNASKDLYKMSLLAQKQATEKIDLLLATSKGQNSTVKFLLKQGADVTMTSGDGITALHIAVMTENEELVRLFENSGINMHAKDKQGNSALHHVKTQTIAQFLLEKGLNLKESNAEGDHPLHVASFWGREAVVQYLLKSGAEVNATNQSGDTAFTIASRAGHESVVRILIAHGVDVSRSMRSLMMASKAGHASVVRLLLEHGVDVNSLHKRETPIIVASKAGHASVVRILIEHGADVESSSDSGSPLMMAAEAGHASVVQILIEHGVRVDDRRFSNGDTALKLAFKAGHARIARILLEHGARSDSNDFDGTRIAQFELVIKDHRQSATLLNSALLGASGQEMMHLCYGCLSTARISKQEIKIKKRH